MTTQRDRLAAVLNDIVHSDDWRGDDPDVEWPDALLARGVRVVDVETLARALLNLLLAGYGDDEEPDDMNIDWDFGYLGKTDMTPTEAATAILAVLDAEA